MTCSGACRVWGAYSHWRGPPPDASHNYVFNGRTPLEWAVDRLHIRQDNVSGIIDPSACNSLEGISTRSERIAALKNCGIL